MVFISRSLLFFLLYHYSIFAPCSQFGLCICIVYIPAAVFAKIRHKITYIQYIKPDCLTVDGLQAVRIFESVPYGCVHTERNNDLISRVTNEVVVTSIKFCRGVFTLKAMNARLSDIALLEKPARASCRIIISSSTIVSTPWF